MHQIAVTKIFNCMTNRHDTDLTPILGEETRKPSAQAPNSFHQPRAMEKKLDPKILGLFPRYLLQILTLTMANTILLSTLKKK